MIRPIVLFDVDGTLCDVRAIRYHVDPEDPAFIGKRNYNRFHSQSEWAPTNPRIVALLSDLAAQRIRIVIVTGREQRWSALTERWLERHEIKFDRILYRPDRDERPDAEIKRAHLRYLQSLGPVTLAVDDNVKVIAMWREESIPVLQVDAEAKFIPIDLGIQGIERSIRKVLLRHRLTR